MAMLPYIESNVHIIWTDILTRIQTRMLNVYFLVGWFRLDHRVSSRFRCSAASARAQSLLGHRLPPQLHSACSLVAWPRSAASFLSYRRCWNAKSRVCETSWLRRWFWRSWRITARRAAGLSPKCTPRCRLFASLCTMRIAALRIDCCERARRSLRSWVIERESMNCRVEV